MRIYILTGLVLVMLLIMATAFFSTKTTERNSPHTFEFIVRDHALVAPTSTFSAVEGDTITVVASDNNSEEIHIHGYDVQLRLKAGATSSTSFVATMSGRFPFEIEDSGTELGEINIMPR